MYKATPLMRELIERTGPKLPSIVNKNLTILPWDWELPSTVLKSEWAMKHKQCFGLLRLGRGESYCAMGLLMHYAGWDGSSPLKGGEFMNALWNHYFASTDIGHDIILYNDDAGLNFNRIGSALERYAGV